MDIKQLRYFVEAFKLQSFTEAAKNCIITPQGIHVSISRLEEEIGSRLFLRTANGLVPTTAGKYLLPRAEEILRIHNDTMEHFAHEAEKDRSVLAFFVRGTVEMLALPSIADFMEKNPNSEVRFRVDQDINCMQAVLNEDADIAVCSGPIQYSELSAKLLFSKNNVLVINKSHPLAARSTVCIEDLKELDLALPRENVSIRNTVLNLCRKKGFEPKYIENDEPRTAFNCAEIGLQAGIVNEVSARKLLKDAPHVTIIPFKEKEMRWDIYMVKKKDKSQTSVAWNYEACLLNKAQSEI